MRIAEKDEPFDDLTAYGNGPQDSVTDVTENAATTHHVIDLGGTPIQYTAKVGHLVTVDPSSSKPAAKIFYVAFTKDGVDPTARPVTFFYNGGPGSSSVYVLLGSFAPMRLKTSLPGFTPPAPYQIETNPDSLLDRSDLVFINPDERPLELTQVPVWRILRHGPYRRAVLHAARGWHRSERADHPVIHSGLREGG